MEDVNRRLAQMFFYSQSKTLGLEEYRQTNLWGAVKQELIFYAKDSNQLSFTSAYEILV